MFVYKFFSQTTGPLEAKVFVKPPRNIGGKFIQMIMVICSSSFSRDLTTNLSRQCRALKIEKLKAPLYPGPEGVMDTND